jgi:hypothetical protein
MAYFTHQALEKSLWSLRLITSDEKNASAAYPTVLFAREVILFVHPPNPAPHAFAYPKIE